MRTRVWRARKADLAPWLPPLSTITVLLPLRAYAPRFLRSALDSILEQTSPGWLLIVIVDEENRPHFEALLAPELSDPRVRLVVNQGRGLPGSLNTGMREADSDFCAILLGDDVWSRNAVAVLEEQIAAHPEVDFFHSSRVMVDENDRAIAPPSQGKEVIRAEDFFGAPPLKHLLCWRRGLGLEIGGMDQSFRLVGPDDYDFPWCMAERGAAFRFIPEVLYLGREHRECYRLSTDPPLRERRREIVRMWRKHGAGILRAQIAGFRRVHLRSYRKRLARWRSMSRARLTRPGA